MHTVVARIEVDVDNRIANAYYEARLPASYKKPTQNSSTSETDRFIREKYLKQPWIYDKLKAELTPIIEPIERIAIVEYMNVLFRK